jgi:hypothetical protein
LRLLVPTICAKLSVCSTARTLSLSLTTGFHKRTLSILTQIRSCGKFLCVNRRVSNFNHC